MEEYLDPKEFGVTRELFDEWCQPRFGHTNPEKIESKVWEWLVRSRMSAYSSRQSFDDPSIAMAGPTWTFERFGQSVTELPDGRTIYIAGEHEDFYDVDFYIYNDVIVSHPDGGLEFYGYPKSDFPPTDFHTATLVDDQIMLIGSLGYRDERKPKETQIYVLRLDGFSMHKVESSGRAPGWIHRHEATLSEDKKSILVTKGLVPTASGAALRENVEDWKLHLDDWHWEQVTSRNWPQFIIRRVDKKMMALWDLRHAVWSQDHRMEDFYKQDMERLEQFIGYRPDVNVFRDLYHFDGKPYELHTEAERYNVFWIYMEEVRIRFTEEMHGLQVVIEGNLAPDKVRSIQEQLMEKLSTLVNSPCEVEEY